MRPHKIAIFLCSLALSISFARSDYLVVSRSATIKADPAGDAQVREHVGEGVTLILVEGQQTNGYYHVQAPTVGGDGWIYRTLVRRYKGQPDGGPSPPPSGTSGDTTTQELLKAAATIKAETCVDGLTMDECHQQYPGGCTKSDTPRYDAYLNFLKNRMPDPTSIPRRAIDRQLLEHLEQGIPPSLTKYNHATNVNAFLQLGEGQIHSLIGYLYYATGEGPESCNCALGTKGTADFHIGVGFDPFPARSTALDALRRGAELSDHRIAPNESLNLKQQSMVVEMTPHYREQFHRSWDLHRVQQVTGKQVKVVGQLMIDNYHADTSQDCGLAGHAPNCWRASVWEIHPVTEFYVCTSSAPCAPDSASWKRLEEYP